MNPDALVSLRELLADKQTVMILLGQNPKPDQVTAALALSSVLDEAGKEVMVAAPNQIALDQDLPGLETIQQKLGNRNLSIKFPYHPAAVDKVSYHISDNNEDFYLIIKPQKGVPPLQADQVSFDYTGAEADIIFLIGIHSLESLEHLYQDFEALYENATLVSVHTFETEIGNLKLDVSKHAAMSEAMFYLISSLELDLTTASATLLLYGIEDATKGFTSYQTNAMTFETVAQLMRVGARRLKHKSEVSVPTPKPSAAEFTLKKSPEPKSVRQVAGGENNSFSQALQQKIEEEEFSAKGKKKKQILEEDEDDSPGGLNYQPGKLEG